MAICEFCKGQIEPGTGKMFVYKDGKIVRFCKSKCEKHHFKLKHKGRTTKWTDEYHRLKKQATKEPVKKEEKVKKAPVKKVKKAPVKTEEEL
jgi:large subunit ribosomal protein L24e